MPEITCSACGKKQATKTTRGDEPRLPRGWKKHERVYCSECWQARYRLRAVTFPLAGVLDGVWTEFSEALQKAWGHSTGLANWAVCELAKADVTRRPEDTRLTRMPPVNLYRLWQAHHERPAWEGAAQSANCLLQSVQRRYLKTRLDVIWRSAAALPRYRYPVPYPVHNQAWEAKYQKYQGSDGQVVLVPVVSLPLGGRRWTLRLLGGKDRRRQLAAFAQIIRGEAIPGELALYRVRASSGDHRGGSLEDRSSGGGQRISYRTLVKLVAWLPLGQEKDKGEHTLLVKTDPAALWVAELEGTSPWICNRDDISRRIEAHRVYRQRMSEDLKEEKRWPAEKRRQMVEALATRCAKQNRWLDSICHELSALLVGYCKRRRVGEVIYDDSDKSYLPSFPWFRLRELLRYKLEEQRMVLTCAERSQEAAAASGAVVGEDLENAQGS